MITAIRTMLLLALGLSATLLADYTGEEATYCAAGSGCAAIRASAWGYVFGVPVPLLGLIAFSVQLAFSLWPTVLGRKVFVATSVLGGVVAVALLGVQAFVIQRFCALCTGVDLATLIAALLAPIYAKRAERGATRPPLLHGMAVAFIGAIAVAAPLGWNEIRPTPPLPPALLALYQPDVVNVVEVADFQCPHCRALHPRLRAAIEAFGAEVRVVRLHYPLPNHRNARIAALAHLCAEAKGRGEEMADFLFTTSDLERSAIVRGPRTINVNPQAFDARSAIVAAAGRLGLDPQAFDACLDGPEASARLVEHLRRVRELEIRAVPTTFIGATSIRGAVSEETVLAALRATASGGGSRGIPRYLYLGLVGVSIVLVIVLARRRPEDA